MKKETCCCDFCGYYDPSVTGPETGFYRCHGGCCPALAETEEQKNQWYSMHLDSEKQSNAKLKNKNSIVAKVKKYFIKEEENK
jgi:hypothetical protein